MATTIPIRISPTTLKLFPSSTNTLFSIHTNKFITKNTNRTKLLFLCLSSRNGTECPVPQEQQPINEYQSLSTSFPFSWAAGDVVEYGSRLLAVGFSFALFVGLPVAWFGTVGAQYEPAKRIVCAASSGVLAVTFAVVRMYLGWAYVGNRLLSATVEYEETGWYDGQIWVKTAEVLTRDRLLGSFSPCHAIAISRFRKFLTKIPEDSVFTTIKYCQIVVLSHGRINRSLFSELVIDSTDDHQVKPVLSRLKITLVGLAACLVTCALILVNIDESYLTSRETGVRAIPGAYNDESARSFEPDAFCGEPDLQE